MKRASDQIDRQAELAERVRKLEIMAQPGAVATSWNPRKLFVHIVASQITLMGAWAGDTSYEHGQDSIASRPFVPTTSRLVYDDLLAQGFGGAQQWTEFLWYMGAIPRPRYVDNLAVAGSPPTASYITVRNNPAFPDQHSPADRVLAWTGLPAGEWTWVASGDDAGVSPTVTTELVPDVPPRDPGLEDIVEHGVWKFSVGGDYPIMSRDNKYVVGGTPPALVYADCEGPVLPAYSGFQYPGIRVTFDSGPDPCPKNMGGTTDGSIIRVWTYLNGDDIYLAEPPRPATAGDTGAGHIPAREWTQLEAYPGLDEMEARVASYLPLFPAVQAFYDGAVTRAIATVNSGTFRHTETFDLLTEWAGVIGAERVNKDRVLLAGQVIYDASARRDTLPPSYIGFLVEGTVGTPSAVTGSDPAHFLAPVTWSTGSQLVLFRFEPAATGYMALTHNLTAIPADAIGPFQIDLDGVAFPVRYDS